MQKINPKIYKDQKRKRRAVPHQTDVDKFFRTLSEYDVHILFGGLLNYFVYRILNEQCSGRSWFSMVDNTKYPYYGKINPKKHIGSHQLLGSKYAWMFQEVSLHSKHIHYYTQIYSLTKGICRSLMVIYAIDIQRR